MLIKKPMTPGSVITLKLTSGEELVARFQEKTLTGYQVSKPMVLTMGPKGVGLMPYLITANMEEDIEISAAVVAVAVATDRDPSDQYIQSTTGIKMV